MKVDDLKDKVVVWAVLISGIVVFLMGIMPYLFGINMYDYYIVPMEYTIVSIAVTVIVSIVMRITFLTYLVSFLSIKAVVFLLYMLIVGNVINQKNPWAVILYLASLIITVIYVTWLKMYRKNIDRVLFNDE